MKLLSFIILIIFSCQSHEIEFIPHNLIQFSANPVDRQDSLNNFNYYVLTDQLSLAELIFPEYSQLNVNSHLNNVNDEKFIGSIGRFIVPYLDSPDELLSVTIYLNEKYGMTKILYDQMLRTVIKKDSKNILSMYLLAELRYNNDYYESASYLINLMENNSLTEIQPVIKIKNDFMTRNLFNYNPKITLEKFIKTNPIYDEEL